MDDTENNPGTEPGTEPKVDDKETKGAGDAGQSAGDAGNKAGDPGAKPGGEGEGKTPSAEELLESIKKLEDEKAKLLKDTMKNKSKAKTAEERLAEIQSRMNDVLGDMDLDEVKKALEERRTAEENRLKAEGDFEALKARLIAEHKKEVEKLTGSTGAQVKELNSKLEAAESEIRRLLVSSKFAASSFLSEELLLTPSKAEKLYGDSFKVEDKNGRRVVVAYLEGEPLVDSGGNPLSFEEAFREIVNRDPERDAIIKPKAKKGAGSGADNGGSGDLPKEPLRGRAAIAAGLSSVGGK
ncbi:MAG: hypothetical protein LPL29_08885 [Alphaproteobacteria bacterium]|nr:hypothetical protein [Alphaproteobacteria bacterium]